MLALSTIGPTRTLFSASFPCANNANLSFSKISKTNDSAGIDTNPLSSLFFPRQKRADICRARNNESPSPGSKTEVFRVAFHPHTTKFSLAYEGQNLCAFEAKTDRRQVVLRIQSFVYERFPLRRFGWRGSKFLE